MNNQETHPLVSVAIITYNQKAFLCECIESCLTQDYPNFEIVVADDGSSDGTREILLEYSRNYPGKFVLRLSDSNLGITVNSNLAHFACSGKYIAWMGGDDLMLPGKLTRQVEFMENNPDCTICYHNLDVFDSDTDATLYFFNEKLKFNGDVRTSIRNSTFNGACSNMIRAGKTPKHGFDKRIPVASDWLYWVETLANGGTIEYIDEVLGRYRRHNNNTTRRNETISQNDVDHLNTCNILIAKYPHYISDVIHAYARKLIGLRHKSRYSTVLWASFRLSPSLKSLSGLLIYYVSWRKLKL